MDTQIQPIRKGRYHAREASGPADLAAAQHLRGLCFLPHHQPPDRRRDGPPRNHPPQPIRDADDLDAACRHILIEDHDSGRLVCTFRFLPLPGGHRIHSSYSARYYNLSRLQHYDAPMVELGRFCIHPDWRQPDILRLAWAAITRFVDDSGCRLLFGCSSFSGTRPDRHAEAFAMLHQRHLAPRRWLPRIKAPDVFRFAQLPARLPPDLRRIIADLPPLLRSYLAMGGWVSDHAVVDPALQTMHVFTGLEVAAIPDSRKRLLRATAATTSTA